MAMEFTIIPLARGGTIDQRRSYPPRSLSFTMSQATILWGERSRCFDSLGTVRVGFESFMSVEVASQSTTSPELLRRGATWPSCRRYKPSPLRSRYSTS